MTRLTLADLAIDAATLGPENPLPVFRAADPDRIQKSADGLPPEERERMGWAAGFRVLPFRMQDSYTSPAPSSVRTIVLENAHLRATFLPDLGAKLMSLVHRPMNRELLERNPVIKFANVALRNAWTSGGIEWNLGHFGHHFLTCAPLFATSIESPDGGPAVRFHEFERCKRLLYQLDVHLPSDSKFLFVSIRVVNLNAFEIPMYWWTNIGVPEAPGIRTLAPAADMIAMDPKWKFSLIPVPRPDAPDDMYPVNAVHAEEAFFRINPDQRPWVASLDSTGRGFVEASTGRLRGRKMYAWGTDLAGQRWQTRLSRPGAAYYEIQAGLVRTQLHSIPMPAHAEWTWTQAFGLLEADPMRTHGMDWNAAWREADSRLEQSLPAAELERRHGEFTSRHAVVPGECLHTGSGWGALERLRMEAEGATMPPGFVFPDSTLGLEQEPWLSLLRTGVMPTGDPRRDPGAWMIQPEWEQRLANSGSDHWRARLHLGVMSMERLDAAGAREEWERSLAQTPSAWALYCLAQIELRAEHWTQAALLLDRAWALRPVDPPAVAALAKAVLDALCRADRYVDALAFIHVLPADIQSQGRVRILHVRAAVRGGQLDVAEALLLGELTDVREGETGPRELWFELHERRIAEAEGIARDDALKARIRTEFPLPASLQ